MPIRRCSIAVAPDSPRSKAPTVLMVRISSIPLISAELKRRNFRYRQGTRLAQQINSGGAPRKRACSLDQQAPRKTRKRKGHGICTKPFTARAVAGGGATRNQQLPHFCVIDRSSERFEASQR